MFDDLTPGFLIVFLACSFLLVLGMSVSFHTYFVPYLQRHIDRSIGPVLPTTEYCEIRQELERSLYSYPVGRYICPRMSLRQCDLPSSRWSINMHCAIPAEEAATTPEHSALLFPKLRRPKQRWSSGNLSIIRESLYSDSSIFIPDSETGVSDKKMPSLEKNQRPRSFHLSRTPRLEFSRPQYRRRHSAPALALLRHSILASEPSPTNTEFGSSLWTTRPSVSQDSSSAPIPTPTSIEVATIFQHEAVMMAGKSIGS